MLDGESAARAALDVIGRSESELVQEGLRLAEADALLEATGGRSLAPFIEEARAEWARAIGEEEGARTHLQEAIRLFTVNGADGHARRLSAEYPG